MKAVLAAIAFAGLLAQPGSVWAIDPQSVQQYCDDIKAAAESARVAYVQTYQPRTDPVKTFNDSIQSCIEDTVNFPTFDFKIPSLGDLQQILKKMGDELIRKVCKAASDQFDRVVAEASSTIAQPVDQVPGIDVYGNSRGVRGGVNIDPVIRDVTNAGVDRVINFAR